MKIDSRVHANCSEWNSEVEDDYIDLNYEKALKKRLLDEAKDEVRKKGWDE
jgi:hypothetical protein